jgi:hypothetical protein
MHPLLRHELNGIEIYFDLNLIVYLFNDVAQATREAAAMCGMNHELVIFFFGGRQKVIKVTAWPKLTTGPSKGVNATAKYFWID